MKYYTVVNEVEALQRAYAVWVCVCLCVCTVRVCVRQCALLYEWGFVCQGAAVIMLPSRSEVFQGRMSMYVRKRGRGVDLSGIERTYKDIQDQNRKQQGS